MNRLRNLTFGIFCSLMIGAAPRSSGPGVRTLVLDDRTVAPIRIKLDGTIISFPTKPTKVILGRQKSFALEYIEADLAIAPLTAQSTSNMFVYLAGRRYAFVLTTVAGDGDTVVMVRDPSENKLSVEIR